MRRVRLGIAAASAVFLLSGAFVFAFAPASADDVAASVSGGSWYWADQNEGFIDTPEGHIGIVPLPNPVATIGDFPVAIANGADNKESYLHVDASEIPAGSTVVSFVLTLHEDVKEQGGGSNQALAAIKAVPVKEFWGDGTYAAPYSVRPQVDTTVGVPGKRGQVDPATQDVTWTFDLAPIVSLWTAGSMENNGVAFVPTPQPTPAAGAPNPSDNWTVIWAGPTAQDPKLRPTVKGSFTSGGGGGSSSFSGLTSGPTESSSGLASGGSLSASPLPSGPALAVQPTVPPSPATTVAPRRTRLISSHPERGLPATFYLAGVAVLGLMAVAALTLGELGEPALERRGSVLRALERRAEGTT